MRGKDAASPARRDRLDLLDRGAAGRSRAQSLRGDERSNHQLDQVARAGAGRLWDSGELRRARLGGDGHGEWGDGRSTPALGDRRGDPARQDRATGGDRRRRAFPRLGSVQLHHRGNPERQRRGGARRLKPLVGEQRLPTYWGEADVLRQFFWLSATLDGSNQRGRRPTSQTSMFGKKVTYFRRFFHKPDRTKREYCKANHRYAFLPAPEAVMPPATYSERTEANCAQTGA